MNICFLSNCTKYDFIRKFSFWFQANRIFRLIWCETGFPFSPRTNNIVTTIVGDFIHIFMIKILMILLIQIFMYSWNIIWNIGYVYEFLHARDQISWRKVRVQLVVEMLVIWYLSLGILMRITSYTLVKIVSKMSQFTGISKTALWTRRLRCKISLRRWQIFWPNNISFIGCI